MFSKNCDASSNEHDNPNVLILLTTFKNPPLFAEICSQLKKTDYPNFKIILIDYGSTLIRKMLEKQGFSGILNYIQLTKDPGAAQQLNVGLNEALRYKNIKYIVRLEGDAVPLGTQWLQVLVNFMDKNDRIAIAMPFDVGNEGKVGYGGRLYGNCTQSPITNSASEFVQCIGTGGHCYITRTEYIRELLRAGLTPYWSPFNISSEDLDFNLKAWLRGYGVVTVGLARVHHEGTSIAKDGSYRAPYRIYNMYKNRICLLLLNFGTAHIIVNIWYRFLHDLSSAIVYSEFVPLIKGYLWVIKNLKKVILERNLRMSRWKRIRDSKLKEIVLIRLPMPIRKLLR